MTDQSYRCPACCGTRIRIVKIGDSLVCTKCIPCRARGRIVVEFGATAPGRPLGPSAGSTREAR